ncbi:hypothetical protein BDV25DRAFT_160686, partial [Aspergillus avenaceus]
MQLVDFLILQTSFILFLGRRCLHDLVGFLFFFSSAYAHEAVRSLWPYFAGRKTRSSPP